MKTRTFARVASLALLSGAALFTAVAAQPAHAATLIDEDFSDDVLGPTPASASWLNHTGHEFGAGSGFGGARGLAFTYDHDNDTETDEISVPGGYEVNGFRSPAEDPENVVYPATLTISVTMPATFDTAKAARLTFFATGREGIATAANSTVSILNATDEATILAPTTPTLNPFTTGDGREKWQFNEFTFDQLTSYAGDTLQLVFYAGGGNGAEGLVIADLSLETDAVAIPEPATLGLLSIGAVAMLRRRVRH